MNESFSQMDFFTPEPKSGPRLEGSETPAGIPTKKTKPRYRPDEVIFGEPIKPDDDCPHNDTYGNCPSCRFKLPFEKPKKIRKTKKAA